MAQREVLLFRFGEATGAIPLSHVAEILRPLPLEPIQDLPRFVRGLALIRGRPIPVVDVSLLLRGQGLERPSRWITVRTERGRLALAVDSVPGVRSLEEGVLEGMPPLLTEAHPDYLEAIGTLDSHLLVILRAARILPEEAWRTLSARGVAS